MSIYTITLKREKLLTGELEGEKQEQRLEQQQQQQRPPLGEARFCNSSGELAPGSRQTLDLNEADWLDCNCNVRVAGRQLAADAAAPTAAPDNAVIKQEEEEEEKGEQRRRDIENSGRGHRGSNCETAKSSSHHSSECLEARRAQLERLEARARDILHSVNVTLEVAADLKQPKQQIVWFKNNRQLTSDEKPSYYIEKASQVQQQQQQQPQQNQGGDSCKRKSVERIRSQKKRQSTSAQGVLIEETTTVIEERQLIVDSEDLIERNKRPVASSGNQLVGGEGGGGNHLIEKCRQVTNERGSKLTIFNLQDDDYGQYICRLIDSEGNQLNIRTNLEQDIEQHQTASRNNNRQSSHNKLKSLHLHKLLGMDEVIEVKEGDLNIELGIQILPETNDDEELMSEEEKAEFIENTSINWFKDDVKLNQDDADVRRLFQFTFDQNEGFHKLIVRKATKETEGVYTCLVENESGTSSCSTQLVVGLGNKPKLTSRLQDVTVYVGQSLEFRIKSTGLPPIDSCQWFKDDELLIELASTASQATATKSTTNERVSMSRSEEMPPGCYKDEDRMLIFKLSIENLKLDDSGRYKCRINNEYGYDESDCFVKVLQEIIEEHEEVEEMIEETLHLGGGAGKKTREEEEREEKVVEETDEQTTAVIKRQRQQDIEEEDSEMLDANRRGGDGSAPQFNKRLVDKTITTIQQDEQVQHTTTSTTTTVIDELICSTKKDEWSRSRDKLNIRWFIDDKEITSRSGGDQHQFEHEITNFYDENQEEIFHKLIIKQRSRRDSSSSGISGSRRRSSNLTAASRTNTSSKSTNYTCRASNQFGESETSSQVTWAASAGRPSATKKAPRFLKKLEDTETSVGETVVFKATVDSETQVDDLRFSRDGKLIYSSKSDGQQRDITTSSGSRIRVRSYEETVEIATDELEENDDADDDVGSYRSKRRYSRTHEASYGTKRRGQTYELTIENVQIDQQAQWECQARNEAGESVCRSDLEVFAEPKIVTDLPESVRVSPGKEIRLHVEASGSPIPVYSWFKDGLGIAEEEDRVFTETKTTTRSSSTKSRRTSVTSLRNEDGISISGETLIIRGSRPEDAGQYSCKIENRLGQVESRACKLTIIGHGDDLKGAPKIIKDFSSDQVFQLDEGETVLLKVLAEGQPKPRQTWLKDSEEIITTTTTTKTTTTTSTTSDRAEVEQDGQEYRLKIKRSQVDDSGKYKVLLRNEFGETESRTVEVKVNKLSKERESQRRPSAPSVTLDTQDKVVGLGSNVVFEAQVAGHPKPLITWYKNGRRMTESSDGRVSFVEEETVTTTTVIETEEDDASEEKRTEKREIVTSHKLIIRNVREADEAIYSLKAENDSGQTKSPLVSLSVDKRKESVDEVIEEQISKQRTAKAASKQQDAVEEEEEEEETTVVTTTTTTTTTRDEDELDEFGQRKSSKSRRRDVTREEEAVEDNDDDELDENGNKRKTIRTTRTTTKTTKTTTTEEEEAEAEENERRRKVREEEAESKKSKRRQVKEVEEEEEVEEEAEEAVVRRRQARKTSAVEDVEMVVEDGSSIKKVSSRSSSSKDKSSSRAMDVDEEQIVEEEEEEEGASRRRSSSSAGKKTKKPTTTTEDTERTKTTSSSRRDSLIEEEEEEEEENTTRKTITTTKRQQQKPRIISAPKEVIAGLGSSPQIEVEVITTTTTVTKTKTTTTTTTTASEDEEDEQQEKATKYTWLKDGKPLDERLLRDKHIELLEQSNEQTGIKKRTLRINSLRSSDAGDYKLRVENPLGKAETEPIKVAIDRTMRPGQRPSVTQADIVPIEEQVAPEILSVPEEVVAGMGSSPQLIAEVSGKPLPEISWFKDGQPLEPQELQSGHLKLVDLPSEQPDVARQALQINNLKPADVAAYHIKAENPLGEVESEPTNVRIDRSMGPGDEPIVSGVEKAPKQQAVETPKPAEAAPGAPTIVSLPEEVAAGRGGSPQIEAEVSGNPKPELTWLKDGQPISDRDLRTGHLEVVDLPTDKPNTVKQALKINDLRPTDVADYQVKAENRLGEVESEPVKVKLDRSMSSQDMPVVKGLQPAEAQRADADQAPAIISSPEEVVAGPGSSPMIEAVVVGTPTPELAWLKDGKPISDRDLRSGHIEVVDLPTDEPNAIKQALKINDFRPTDVAEYQVRAENPLGTAESEPTSVQLDRSMGRGEEPVVKGLQPVGAQRADADAEQSAPVIISAPKEVVAGPGSSPMIEAVVVGTPTPELAWLKDGKPISDRDLRSGHIEVVDLPTDEPNAIKQALKINDFRPTDVAEYQVRAENPLGTAESEPTSVKLDRSMGRGEEPVVKGLQPVGAQRADADAEQSAPVIISAPKEVVAGPGSSPMIEAVVVGTPTPELAWLKDGKPISDRDLRSGHIEVVDLPTDEPNAIKQALKINDFRPTDVAEYQVRAENPLGTAESEPTSVKLDRSMGPREEPKVIEQQLADQPRKSSRIAEAADDQVAPSIVSMPDEIVAGRGAAPQIEAEVCGNPKPEITWLKDGQPISDRDLRTGHLEVVDLPTDKPDSVKQALVLNDFKPTDVAEYQVEARNPLGTVESEPTSVKLDRSMTGSDEPIVRGLDKLRPERADQMASPSDDEKVSPDTSGDQVAPEILSVPEEVVAGMGSSPQLIAEVSGKPLPEISWFKDGQPLEPQELQSGHLKLVDLPSEQPDVARQALQINNLKPADVAAYHIKAENPLGEVESEPTNVRIDRSMGPGDEPIVSGVEKAPKQRAADNDDTSAPRIISAPEEVVAGRGSSPVIEAEVVGNPKPELTWLKDGEPISDRDLRSGHIEVVDLPTDEPNAIKQALKINDLRPTDVAEYQVRAKNPLGTAESQPTHVKLDKSMGPGEEPVVKGLQPAEAQRADADQAPAIISSPKEVVAGPGSSPMIEAVVVGTPTPELAWLKDGKPISDRDLRSGHIKVVDLPTDEPNAIKQALKINDFRPTDVAEYQVRAENPLGTAESEPTSVQLDRSMGRGEEPVVKGLQPVGAQRADADAEQSAPAIISAPKEVVAGPGSSPMIEAVVVGTPTPELAWLKDGKPISDRDLRSGHIEVVDLPTDEPNAIKQALKINDFRPTDVAEYQVRAENPLGTAESQPAHVKLDKSMGPGEEPVVKGLQPAEAQRADADQAPAIISSPKEVVAGPGSSPMIEAVVVGTPTPELAWLKDGKPISDRDLRSGHIEVVDLPTDEPNAIKQALKINDFRPTDVAEYQVRAENPLGTAESEPTSVKLDRSMGRGEEPVVKGLQPVGAQRADADAEQSAPVIISAPKEVVAGPGSSPMIEAVVVGTPTPELAWLKDGKPISDRDLRSGHIEVVDLPTDEPNAIKQALKINDFRPTDVAEYQVRAENPLGTAESEPTSVKLDRSMGRGEEPVVKGLQPVGAQRADADAEQSAPVIISAPKEVVAGPGSSPMIEAVVVGTPTPELAWLKDGKPISDRDLRSGHIEVVDLPTDEPNAIKQALKINDFRPTDVAEYQVRAENPLGTAESEPTSVKLDRSMGPREEPKVIEQQLADQPRKSSRIAEAADDQVAPSIVSMPDEIVAGPGAQVQIVAEASGNPRPQLTWFKDGQPLGPDDMIEGKLELVDLASERPDCVRQALQISKLRPVDMGAYHVRAENPLGECDSSPTNLRLDRKMSAQDEPQIIGGADQDQPMEIDQQEPPQADERRLSLAQQLAPEIISSPSEVVAALGSSPKLEVEVRAAPEAQVSWLKDGQPIASRLLRDGHLEQLAEGTQVPGVKKYSLVVNDLRPSDVAAYTLQAENPLGAAESQPIKLRADRSMSRSDEPVVVAAAQDSTDAPPEAPREAVAASVPGDASAPAIVSMPEEVVAGMGSSPQLIAEVSGKPLPEISWFKDGQPLEPQELQSGHLKLVDLPSEQPDVARQALQISNLKPADVAAYHIKAENPLGEVESEPTNVRIDRSMGPKDEPQVTGETPAPATSGLAKPRISPAARNIRAPLGSSPVLEVEVSGEPDKLEWLKDGKPVGETLDMHLELEQLPDGRQRLRINNLKPQDEGVYTLRASNAAGQAESGPIKLSVDVGDAQAPDQPLEEHKPEILNATEEIVAGPGSRPVLEVTVRALPEASVTWYKDGKALNERQLGVGHLALTEQKSNLAPNAIKYQLRVERMRPSDAGTYHLVAHNPLGVAESVPIHLQLDEALDANETPIVKSTIDESDSAPAAGGDQFAPQILSMTDEIVAGPASSPAIEAIIKAKPEPDTCWLKDGQPLDVAELTKQPPGHLELIREPLEDGRVRETLKINKLRPDDVAAYQVCATNPFGTAESELANVRLDRSMGPGDEPQVSKRTEEPTMEPADTRQAPVIRRIPRQIVAPLGSAPVIEVEISGSPRPEVSWFKDGRQVNDVRGHLALVESPQGGQTYKLCISNLKAVDQGDYSVAAINELGEVQSAPISLIVDANMGAKEEPRVVDSQAPLDTQDKQQVASKPGYAPVIQRVSDKLVAPLGGQAQLEVEVKAAPGASVDWLVDGERVPTKSLGEGHVQIQESELGDDVTRYTLTIDSLKPSDAGSYQLIAENEHGSAKSPKMSIELRRDSSAAAPAAAPEDQVEAGPDGAKRPLRAPVIKRAPRQVVASEGSSPVLEVEVSGEPVPEIRWFRNGKLIERSDAHFTFDEQPDAGVYRLVINEVEKERDEAVYTLSATNEVASVESGPIELRVEAAAAAPGAKSRDGHAPQVLSSPDEIVAGVGSSPVIEIVVRCSPRADHVSWFKDGQPISELDKRLFSKLQVSETISQTQDGDTVTYVLKIADLRPQDLGAYHLRVENEFGCVETEPTNVRIDRSMGAHEEPQVTKGQADDEVEGVAPAQSSEGKPSRPVIRAPVIKRMPRRVVAGVGSSPVIEVEISGEPRPEIIWFKNGKQLRKTSRLTFEELPGGVYRLQFSDVKLIDQAEYSFTATNEAGNIDSGPIELLIDKSLASHSEPFVQPASELPVALVVANADGPIEAPRILELGDQEALAGQTVRLEAEVTGNPRPDIKWLKDGDEVELNVVNEVPGSNRHSLTLKNVSDLYDGTYSLEATNIAGSARKDAKVKIVDQLSQAAPAAEAQVGQFDQQPAATKRKSAQIEQPMEKPFIKKGLKFSQVNQGRSIKFEVQIDGKYDELIWMKDGEQINVPMTIDHDDDQETDRAPAPEADHDDDASTLKASDDDDDDERATADQTQDDDGVARPQRKFAPRIIRRPRNVVAGPGSRVAFEVEFEGEPVPEVIWFKNETDKLHTSTESSGQLGKVTIEQVSESVVRLVIEDVQPADEGAYHVLVENAYGAERSIPVTLELDTEMPASDDLANTKLDHQTAGQQPLKQGRAPRVLIRPRAVHAPSGSRVSFEVQVVGEPEPMVSWFRDGKLISQTADGHVSIEEFSSGCQRLVLNNITDSDVGQYHIVAENKLGSERTIPVTLTLDDDDTHEPEDLAGDGHWLTNKDKLDQEERKRRNLGRPPRILLRPKRLVAPLGGEATLEVSVVGQTRGSDLIWYKDGKRIDTTTTTTTTTTSSTATTTTTKTSGDQKSRVRVEKVGDGYEKLIISELVEGDSGRYSVSAANDFGVSMSQEVDLNVSATTTTSTEETTTTTSTESLYETFVDDLGPSLFAPDRPAGKRAPRFTLRPRNRRAPVKSNVDFEVRVSGEPRADIIWFKNGRRIHATGDGRVRVEESFSDGCSNSRLVLEDLEESDDAVYSVEASNAWGKERVEDVRLRVTQRTEISQRTETSKRRTKADGSAQIVTTKTKTTRSHYTFSEEPRIGYVTLTINDAQLDHDGDYKLIVRNRCGEASTQAPLVVIPRVEPRAGYRPYSSASSAPLGDDGSSEGRESRARRTPLDELDEYGHELDKSVGLFGSESRYQSGEDTYLLQLRDTEFPLRLRKYLRFGARQSPSLRSNLMDAHWGAGARVTIRERRKFREVMDEEIDDEKMGRDLRATPMRLQKEVGTCGYAAAQLEHLRVEAGHRVTRLSAEGGPSAESPTRDATASPMLQQQFVDMMPPFFREKLKDCVIEESASGQQEALFACLAAGEPKPDYSWFRNDVIITPADEFHQQQRVQISQRPDGGSELRIKDPRLTDSGCFKCVANNVHGNVSCRARLRVASRPSRPEPAEVVSVSAREVFLKWRPPRDYDTNAADVLGYRLEMSKSSLGDLDEQWHTLAADIGHEFYVVDDLEPGQSYAFRISARNKFGWSDSSYCSYLTTSSDAASGGRLTGVPHEMRSRQFVSEVCDPHMLRHCEDAKRPKLNYALEQTPICAQNNANWLQDIELQAEIARGRFSVISKGLLIKQQAGNGNGDPNEDDQSSIDGAQSQLVALKVVANKFAQEAQIKNEFDLLRSLRHEKVVGLVGAYRDNESFVFVMERLSGLDVLTYLSSFNSYNEDLVSRIIQQVMDAIEYLHFRGMCLLELQPDNVVMTNGRTSSLKLVDFSSARFVPKQGARVPANHSQIIEYCPPEVIAGHEVSTDSDVWCIGVLTYLLLSGFSPFRGQDEDETRENVRLGRYKYDHLYGNCTPEVTRFLINVFKKHSSKRPTIEQLFENKWLLPNEFMIRKRQHAIFKTDKIVAFAEEFHRTKQQQQ